MTAITESSIKVKGLIDEVSAASQQQTQGIDQVTQAIMQMEKVTHTTAATAEESAAASEELNAQAEQSMDVVARLEALVGASDQGAHAPGRPAPRPATASNVMKMTSGSTRAKRSSAAEEQIPLEGTGTFGKF